MGTARGRLGNRAGPPRNETGETITMTPDTAALVAALAELGSVIGDLTHATVDSRLARGRLWLDLWPCGMETIDAVCQEVDVDLTVARQERWVATRIDAPLAPWLDWTATRALAGLPESVRADILADARAAGTETSAAVGRLVRAHHAATRAAKRGDGPAGADPADTPDRMVYVTARLDEELGVDFDATTVARIARCVRAALDEWERAAHGDMSPGGQP